MILSSEFSILCLVAHIDLTDKYQDLENFQDLRQWLRNFRFH